MRDDSVDPWRVSIDPYYNKIVTKYLLEIMSYSDNIISYN
jgi:hypothetical protein